MSIRTQLLLVSALTLILPWAGCQYAREMETALRVSQEDALLDSTLAVASALRDRPGLLYGDRERGESNRGGASIYAHRMQTPVRVDGFVNDWNLSADTALHFGDSSGVRGSFLAGIDARYLYLFLDVQQALVRYANPLEPDASTDRVAVAIGGAGRRTRYLFVPQAPGPVVAARAEGGDPWQPAEGRETRFFGEWQQTADGYHLEARIPLSIAGDRLGFTVRSHAGSVFSTLDTDSDATPGLLRFTQPALDLELREFHQADKRLTVADKQGWRVGVDGSLGTAADRTGGTPPGVLSQIFSIVLAQRHPAYELTQRTPGRVSGEHVEAALNGLASTAWYRLPGQDRAVLAAAQPIYARGQTVGAVVLEQTSEEVLTLASAALTQLVGMTLGATLVVTAVLLGFATLLSVRIRRLRNAAEVAVSPDGRIDAALPSAGAGDELGDLSRSFSGLLSRLDESTRYLQTLAGKLSHELRTPLAVVRSSLDNLDAVEIPEPAQAYARRAKDGAERLRIIITAMSEANRTEQSIRHAEPEQFNLAELVSGTVSAYADLYSARTITSRVETGDMPFTGVPDLVVQMLDKLVDNAVDFTPAGGTISVGLQARDESYRLSVQNTGSRLPDTMQSQLFESMVSVRHKRGDDPHLGFGLFIVRLIVEFHGGTIAARNLPGESGVEFCTSFPKPERHSHGKKVSH